MASAGEFLKAERLKQNKTLKEIAKSTRIGVFLLDALEADKTEYLPPAAYVKGFIKAYASELDINPEEPLALYKTQIEEDLKLEHPKEPKPVARRFIVSGYVAPLIAGALLLLICAVYFSYMGRSSDDTSLGMRAPDYAEDGEARGQPKDAQEALESQVQPVLSAPEAVALQTVDNATPDTNNHFTVRFAAAERSWMRFTVDDKHVFEVFLKPGETYSVNAVSVIKVRIGNPGGLSAFYNDAPVTVPGRRGIPVEMSFPLAANAKPVQ